MKRRIEIGGQDFDVLESFTLEQELYLAGLIRRGKLDRIKFDPAESYDEATDRLHQALEESRVGRAVLSVLIVPAGEPWSMEQSQKTAAVVKEWIGAIDDNTDRILAVVIYQALFDRGILRSARRET